MIVRKDRVLAVHIRMDKDPQGDVPKKLEELSALIQADGGEVIGTVVQRIKKANSSTLLGSGQIMNINDTATQCDAEVIVFNRELSPSQQRNIEYMLDKRLIDRTRLIIDIFARRANSREGKLEVEEALLRYMLPRLTGKGIVMSQTGGGVGTRGPGETKLEIDRRRIKERLGRIKQLMDTVKKQRMVQQGRRTRTGIPLISLVGYTSAGKSTLLNRLARAYVQSSDDLFTTLDPVSKRLYLKDGSFALVTDTVGFIEDLPVQLIRAFRTTLEDVSRSDLLLFLIDVSKPDYDKDINVVMDILKEIHADSLPIIYVFNKIDKLDSDISLKGLTNNYESSILVSARDGTGIDMLKDMIINKLFLIKHVRDTQDKNELHRVV